MNNCYFRKRYKGYIIWKDVNNSCYILTNDLTKQKIDETFTSIKNAKIYIDNLKED